MAITISKYPTNYTTVNDYDDLTIEASSNLYNQTDMYYLYKTYYKTTNTDYTLLSTNKYYPISNVNDVLNTKSEFNPHKILKSKMGYNPNPFIKAVTANTYQSLDYKVEVTDWYNTSSSGSTAIVTGVTDISTGMFNYYGETQRIIKFDVGTQGQFLTKNLSVNVNDYQWNTVSVWLQEADDAHLKCKYTIYTGTTSTVLLYDIHQPMYITRHIQIPASYRNLQDIIPTGLTNWTKIEMEIYQDYAGGQVHSNKVTINRTTDSCSRFTQYQLYYLNELGGWDTFTCNKKTTKQFKVERLDYVKRLRTNYNNSDRGRVNVNTSVNDIWTLNTKLLDTDAEVLRLVELLKSKEVYIILNDNDLFAINILNNEIPLFESDNGDILQYTIQFEFANRQKKY